MRICRWIICFHIFCEKLERLSLKDLAIQAKKNVSETVKLDKSFQKKKWGYFWTFTKAPQHLA